MLTRLLKYLPLLLAFVISDCSGGGYNASSIPAHAVAALGYKASSARSLPAVGGTIGLSDDFSSDKLGAGAAGWGVISGNWVVCQTGSVQSYCQTSASQGLSLAGGMWWSNYTVQAQFIDQNLSYGGTGIVGRATSNSQYYTLQLRPQMNGTAPYWYLLKIGKGPAVTLASGQVQPPDNNQNYGLQLSFSGTQITASIAFDGGSVYKLLGVVNDSSYSTGQVGLITWGATGRSFQDVLVTLLNSTLPTQSAISVNTFIDSIGINGHFESKNYYDNLPQEHTLVANLGVRHYRVSGNQILIPGVLFASNLANLHRTYGTTFDLLSNLQETPADVVKSIGMLPSGSVDTVEGPNESDNPGQGANYDPNFATDIPAYMQAMYPVIKSAVPNIGVIGPSFYNYTSYAAIGNISASVDSGNIHDYLADYNPGTAGWGGGGFGFAPGLNYGSIPWNIAAAQQATKTRPIVATETGYYTAPVKGALPFDVQAKYVPRLYLEQFLNKISRTFVYQLIDDNDSTAGGTLGIVSAEGYPTPSYTALAGLISTLSDGSTNSSPTNFAWGLSGQAANVHDLLMHKADGTIVIPMWIEVESFDPNANGGFGAEINVQPQAVTVNVSASIRNGALLTCNPKTGIWTNQPVAFSNGSYTFNVSDSVSVLEITP